MTCAWWSLAGANSKTRHSPIDHTPAWDDLAEALVLGVIGVEGEVRCHPAILTISWTADLARHAVVSLWRVAWSPTLLKSPA